MKKICTLFAAILSLNAAQAQIISFEDLTVPAGGYWKGQAPVPKDSGFQSNVGFFVNSWDTSFGGSWSGWGFSNRQDSTSISYTTNELASIAGSGNNNSANYAVAYQSYNPAFNIIRLPKDYQMGWAYLTNTTIAYRSMQNGDGFAKKFGGATGNDPDFFKVRFTGWLNGVAKTDTVDFYLADYRDTNNVNDYIVKDWRICNLSTLGKCDSLTYVLSSSDTGAFGMNTPAYFCMDDIQLLFTGTEELDLQLMTTIYPNPFQDYILLSNQSTDKIQADLISMNGSVLQHIEVAQGDRKSIQTHSLAPGYYVIRIQQGSAVYFKKMIK
jgi:hypothetical protein